MKRRVAACFCLALVVTAFSAVAASAHTPLGAEGGQVLTAGSKAEEVAARLRFFGPENVNPATGEVRRDRLILSWFGVTNFAMAIRGHVVLLDAWVPRGAHSNYVPVKPAELAALRPEAILIGHAHFDHAADAVPIAEASGARLVGTAEHCQELQERTERPLRCLAALDAEVFPGTRTEQRLLSGVKVTTVKSLHSALGLPDGGDGLHVPVTPAPSTTVLTHPPTSEDLVQILGHLPDSEGGSVLYRFRVRDFKFAWNDTAGPLSEKRPQAYDTLRELGPVDLQVGAIQGFNQFTNGMRDPRKYIEALRPREFVPSHHDDWAVGITTNGAAYRKPLADELDRVPESKVPKVHFITDPGDYVDPEELTWKLPLPRPELRVRCHRRSVAARLANDNGAVREVEFTVDGNSASRDPRAPFELRTDTRGKDHRVHAEVTSLSGQRRVVKERC